MKYFNDKLIQHLENKQIELVNLVKQIVIEKTKSEVKLSGNQEVLGAVDWTDKIVDAPVRMNMTTYDGDIVSITESYRGKQYGIDKKGFTEVIKVTKQICKSQNIKQYSSYNTILNTVIDWIFKKYKNKRLKQPLWKFISKRLDSTIKVYNVYFPISFLDINKPLIIGNVRITYFDKEYLIKIRKEFEKKKLNPKEEIDPFIDYLKGKVFAVVGLKGEPQKVTDLAYNECLLALDCMRICSPIMGHPKMISDFDLERNSNVIMQTDNILQLRDNAFEFTMNKARQATIYNFDDYEFKIMNSMQLGQYHHFLIGSKRESEIEKLILRSIRLFSSALKDKTLPSRISKIFTIYESLLLQNSESGIINSIVKYGPKLIFDSIEDRNKISKIFKELYKVRSAYVHHAKNNNFKLEHLQSLQIGLSMLLTNLIQLSKRYKTKESILNKVDLEINSSFKLWEELGRKKQQKR